MSKKSSRKPKEAPIIRESVRRKEYAFRKENTALNFTLRTDVPEEMKAFLALIEVAKAEIEADLALIEPKATVL